MSALGDLQDTQPSRSRSRTGDFGPILDVRGIDVAYGQTQVLFGVDFTVDSGEIVALLGTNGAGKSTVLRAISGSLEPSRGTITFEGRDITRVHAEQTARAGVVMVPGGKGVFPTLTVNENLELATWLLGRDKHRAAAATEVVFEHFPILRDRRAQRAGDLSGGEQQMLTIGQALLAQPRLLMIDELSLGLAPKIVEQLLAVVRDIARSGTTIVLVEQSVNVSLTIAERAIFMEKGEVRFNGPTRELLDRPDVLRSVFLQGAASLEGGGIRAPIAARARRERHREVSGEAPALAVTGLAVAFGGIRAVQGVDLQVRQGEVLGLIGPNGAGKTTVFDLISGFLAADAGTVSLDGEDVTDLGPDARARHGLGRSFQDARLFPSLTVAEAIAGCHERHLTVRDPLAAALSSPATRRTERDLSAQVSALIDLMHLDAYANKFVSELSTGTRRIVDIACCLAHRPSVLLLDEPSSGIAQRETEALGPVLLRIRDQIGCALLVIEHDMPLISTVCDEILALELGSVVTQGSAEDVMSHPQVVASYLGTTDAVNQRSGAVGSRLSQRRPVRANPLRAKPTSHSRTPRTK